MGKMVGIDLGTTNSVVAALDKGGYRILDNRENEPMTRSAVCYWKGEFLVGTPAIKRWTVAPKDTIISIKRLMGRAVSDIEVEKVKKSYEYDIIEPSDGTKDGVRVRLGGKEYSPEDISAMILRKLKNDAEFRLGEEVTHAVITVPAYFSDKQRQATWDAGLKAGLTVMKIFDEPTAAAIAYGIEEKEREAKTIIVYDLGGGTFDVSVLVMATGTFAPLNLEGDMWLGGDDFDKKIVDYAVEMIKKEHGIDPKNNYQFMSALKLEAQRAKETLSSSMKTELLIPGILKNISGEIIPFELEITRGQFEEMIKPLVDKTVALVKKALENENVNLQLEDIDYVLMVGNSSLIPMIQQAIENLFGKEKVIRKIHPKHSVAMGAALVASVGLITCPECLYQNDINTIECKNCKKPLTPEKYKDDKKPFIEIDNIGCIAAFSYGIQTAGDKYNVFINKGDRFETPDDKRLVQTFYTRFPHQRTISIPVYGGNNLDFASRNEKQGEASAILPPNCPEGTRVRIKLWLNRNGFFELKAQLENGYNLQPTILRGGSDQRAIQNIDKVDKAIAEKEGKIPPTEMEKIERKRNDLLNDVEGKNFEKAEEEATVLINFIEEIGKEDDTLKKNAEGMIGYGTYISNQYGWLLGQSAFNINSLLGQLREAFDKNDSRQMELKTNELSEELDRLMQQTDFSGKSSPTMFGVFIRLHMSIVSVIQRLDPVEANNLREELYGIENAFKKKQERAMDLLNTFIDKVTLILEKAKKNQPEGIKCPSCGHMNRLSAEKAGARRYCENEKCRADLWLLGHENATNSKDINGR